MPIEIELDIPKTAEEREALRLSGGWDRWYANLPNDLKRRLSIHDFKRLGDVFRQAFEIPETRRPINWGTPEMSGDMSKATAREAGWYWTRSQYGLWEPNKWHPQGEWETENQYGKRGGEPYEIGPRILDPEAAASEQAELLAALRRIVNEERDAPGIMRLIAAGALAKAEER